MRQGEISKKILVDMQEILPKMTQYYVELYGEKHRNKITKVLNQIDFVFFANSDQLGEFMEEKQSKKGWEQRYKEFETLDLPRRGTYQELYKDFSSKCNTISMAITSHISMVYKINLDRSAALEIRSILTAFTYPNQMEALAHYLNMQLIDTGRQFDFLRPIYQGKNLYDLVDECAEAGNKLLNSKNLLLDDALKVLEEVKKELSDRDYANLEKAINGPNKNAFTATSPKRGKDELSTVVCLPIDLTMRDVIIWHELMHVVDSYLYLNPNELYYGCGLPRIEQARGEDAKKFYSQEDVALELLTFYEVFTDYKATGLVKKAKEDGFEIIDNENTDQSLYAKGFELMSPLFELVKPELNEICMKGEESELYDLMGKENFLKLIDYLHTIVHLCDETKELIQLSMILETNKHLTTRDIYENLDKLEIYKDQSMLITAYIEGKELVAQIIKDLQAKSNRNKNV